MTAAPVLSITDELLAELEEKAKAATQGPWVHCDSCESESERWVMTDDMQWSICSVHSGVECEESEHVNSAFIAAANPATLLALIAHIRSLEARLAYIDRNFVGATFDYDGDGMAAMVVRISDRVSVCRDAMAVLDAAIAQEASRE